MQNPWRAGAGNTWVWIVGFALVLAAMRAVGMLGPAHLRWLLPLGFVLMMLAPWVVLNREGRRQIGLARPASAWTYLPAVLIGALAAALCFGLGMAVFGLGADNWFVTIASYYRRSVDTSNFTLAQLHLTFTLPALLFSPVGEELFFRGVLQRALEERLNTTTSTVGECAAFGLVHLCHHGLLPGVVGVILLPWSGAIWVLLMFALALYFARLRRRSHSLLPPIAAHAAFNLTMNVFIFSLLWTRLTPLSGN